MLQHKRKVVRIKSMPDLCPSAPAIELFFMHLIYVCYDSSQPYNSIYSVTGGDWVLAFRAVKANNVSVFNTWTNSNLQHGNPVSDSFPLACLRLVNTGSCDRHFRSQILNNWTNIKEVCGVRGEKGERRRRKRRVECKEDFFILCMNVPEVLRQFLAPRDICEVHP